MVDQHLEQDTVTGCETNQSIKARTKDKFNQLLSRKSLSHKPKSNDSISDKAALIDGRAKSCESINNETVELEDNRQDSDTKAKHTKNKERDKKKRSKTDGRSGKTLKPIEFESEAIELQHFGKDASIHESNYAEETAVVPNPGPPDISEAKKVKMKHKRKKHKDEEIEDSSYEPNVDNKGERQTIENVNSQSENVLTLKNSPEKSDISSLGKADSNVFGVLVHGSDPLRKSDLINQPSVKIHFIDLKTGKYSSKSSKGRCVTSYYESSDVDYILPILTKPFNVIKQHTRTPFCEEMVIFNESYSHILDQESLLVFEILDAAINCNISQKMIKISKGWSHVCWGFLKLKGANGVLNTQKRLRLQLYKPARIKTGGTQGSNIYDLWRTAKRAPYPSTLYVTVKSIGMPQNLPSSIRSLYPTQEEKSNESILNEVKISNSKSSLKTSEKPIWTRLPSQPCRIPNVNHLSFKPAVKGCFVARFSQNGKYLACGCQNEFNYPIKVYNFPSGEQKQEFGGHAGIIYEVDWSKNDKFLLSSSADCTVQIWDAKSFAKAPIAVLPHPAFVYAAKFHSVVDLLIVSGCYDTVIRVWSIKQASPPHNAKLIQELEGHTSHVNSLCFAGAGHKLYSADGSGKILVWNAYFTEQPSKKGVARDWTLYSEIEVADLKGVCINHIEMHPSNHKLSVHTRNNIIKMVDLRVSTVTVRLEGFINYQELIRSSMSPCGSFIFSGSEDGHVHVWRCDTGEKVTVYTDLPYKCTVNTVCFHPHDNFIVFCAHGRNQPVIVYKYSFDIEAAVGKTEPKLRKSSNGDVSYDSLKKHVSFDTDLRHSARVKKAINNMDSVIDSSLIGHLSTQNTDMSVLSTSSINPTTINPSALSPHAFLLPALAAEVQKQLLNRTKDSSNQRNVKVTLSGKAKSPLFNFRVPSSSSNDSALWVKALYNYTAARSDELSFSPGESIRILYKDSDSWWMGEKESTGEQGFFPVNYIRMRKTESDNNDNTCN